MKKLKEYIDFNKIVTFFLLSIILTFSLMMKESKKNYRELLLTAPEYSSMGICELGRNYTEEELKEIAEYFKKDETVENIYVHKDTDEIFIQDNARVGMQYMNLHVLDYDERYEKYVDGPLCDEMEGNEIIIPKYYMPGDRTQYNENGFIDGDTLVGSEIEFSVKLDDADAKEATVKLKVVGTYDNIKALNSGDKLLGSDETKKYLHLSNKKNSEETYKNSGDFIIVQHKSAVDTYDYGKTPIVISDELKHIGYSPLYQTEEAKYMVNDEGSKGNIYTPVVILCIVVTVVVILMYIRKGEGKADMLNQAAGCMICQFITFIVSHLLCLYVIVTHNNEKEKIYDFTRNYMYSYGEESVIYGVVFMAVSILLCVLAVKKNKTSEEME